MNNEAYQNVKMWRTTIHTLRQIYALSGEKMVAIMDRLAKAELERLQQVQIKEGDNVSSQQEIKQ